MEIRCLLRNQERLQLLCSSDDENDDTDDEDIHNSNNFDPGFSVPSPSTIVPPAPSDIPPTTDTGSHRQFVPSFELKEILTRIENKIDNIPVNDNEEKLIELKAKIRECFRCVVCMDDCLDNISVCYNCNRLIGCRDCISPLDCCPLCRGTFDAPPPAVKIPGLELLLRGDTAAI